MVDVSCEGTFMLKSEDDAWTLFENLSENSLHHSSSSRRTNTRSQTLYEVSQPLDLNAKVDALSRKLDQLLASGFVPETASHIHKPHVACSFCSDPSHQAGNCLNVGQSSEPPFEQMNAVYSRPVSDHFNNSYNPVLRNNSSMWRPNVPQYNGLQNQAYQQSNNQFYQPSPNSRPPNPQ
jgi:Fe2+ or Zn2+ uptake regulation protein